MYLNLLDQSSRLFARTPVPCSSFAFLGLSGSDGVQWTSRHSRNRFFCGICELIPAKIDGRRLWRTVNVRRWFSVLSRCSLIPATVSTLRGGMPSINGAHTLTEGRASLEVPERRLATWNDLRHLPRYRCEIASSHFSKDHCSRAKEHPSGH